MNAMKTPSDYSAFLESLKVKNEGPRDDQHQWPLDAPLAEIRQRINDEWDESDNQEVFALDAWDYFEHRCAIAEQNRIPETLAEDVKAFMRAVIDTTMDFVRKNFDTSESGKDAVEKPYQDFLEFRRLSEPDKQGEG